MKRVNIRVRGIVQGVGYRPFVAVLAKQYNLIGHTYNDNEGVVIEVEGPASTVHEFASELRHKKPALSEVTSVETVEIPLCGGAEFTILPSKTGPTKNTLIAPDTAPCEDCLIEMKTSGDRRYRYPFINCTNCGPRYSLIKTVPYDRQNTTMSEFPMCDFCESQYEEETNRRYHAEPIACDVCGPHYTFWETDSLQDTRQSQVVNSMEYVDCADAGEQALNAARSTIIEGKILAVKGVGGYHLACDATNEEAVQRLRTRKHRPNKPLACMAGSLKRIQTICEISKEEERLLLSAERPIVLLRLKTTESEVVMPAPSVSPENRYLGVMLAYAPIHHLLLQPEDLWVMTSGNRSGDPVLFKDEQAKSELNTIADTFLGHNRGICAPVDDSVLAIVQEKPLFYRRSRGYVPLPLRFKEKAAQHILATGSDLKNAFALVKEDLVFMGPHMGDLENAAVYEMYKQTEAHFEDLFSIAPQLVVSDSHPNYFSSRFGKEFAKRYNIPFMTVQHHEAHIAAVMAEHNILGPVLGIALDGTGYGIDGTVWGGEIMQVSTTEATRLAHLKETPLPGGEMSVREPWRQALWYLQQCYGDGIPSAFTPWLTSLPKGWEILLKAMHNGLPMIQTSSAGRLFDAAGSLLGLGYIHSFDGQIAMALEQLADDEEGVLLPYTCVNGVIDMVPAVQAIIEQLASTPNNSSPIAKNLIRRKLAASFHTTLAAAITTEAKYWQNQLGLTQVVLSGGVFQNRRLCKEMQRQWPEQEFLIPRAVPPNDGGLALGQAWLAMHRYTV